MAIQFFELFLAQPHRNYGIFGHTDMYIEEIYRRKGEWHARKSNNLRVVLDHENIQVTDNYENSNSAYDDDGFGQLIGSIFGELLTSFTDDEYNIEYYRTGNELYLKWYNHEYQAYRRLQEMENSLTQ